MSGRSWHTAHRENFGYAITRTGRRGERRDS